MPGMITVMGDFRHAVTIRIYEGHAEESHLSLGIHAVNIPLCGVTHRIFVLSPRRKSGGLNALIDTAGLTCLASAAALCHTHLMKKATTSNLALLTDYWRKSIPFLRICSYVC